MNQFYTGTKRIQIFLSTNKFEDAGALGSDRNRKRIVKIKPLLRYFYQVTFIDTTRLDKTDWIFVNEEDIH